MMTLETFSSLLSAWVTDRCNAESVDVASAGLASELLDGVDRVVLDGNPCRSHPILRVDLFDDGALTVLTFRPALAVWVEVAVAQVDTAAGTTLQVTTGRERVDRVLGHPPNATQPWIAKIAVVSGTPITEANAMPTPDARSGDGVQVLLGRGSVVLKSEGRLLDGGRVGDRVRVAVTATGTVLNGVLVAANRVEVL